MIVLHLVSTPLHFFIASNIAISRACDEHHLVIIDQINIENNFILKAENKWGLSPFQSVEIFQGRIKNNIEKWKSRKRIFDALKNKILSLEPDEISTGNDRRVEFQFCMHVAQKRKKTTFGSYLDEGMYTYLGRGDSKWFFDRYIDNFFKKLFYGFWWQSPKTIGESSWVKRIYAAFPGLVVESIKNKELIQIDPAVFRQNAISNLSEQILQSHNIDVEKIKSIDMIILIPHESIYMKYATFKNKILDLIGRNQNLNIAVKYHPRDTKKDRLALLSLPSVSYIPEMFNFESMLPQLEKATIVGDVSSVLLTARWLRPDLKAVALMEKNVSESLKALFKKLNITIENV